MKNIFIRNDDVRESLDPILVEITELLLEEAACITHAVEPANVSNEVVDWLVSVKKLRPSQIEIIQHGYDHNIRKLYPYGTEFGGRRSFESQFQDLKCGVEQMNNLFGDNWNKVMAFPYGTYNKETLKAVEKLNFKAITTSIDFTFLRRIKNHVGQLLDLDFIVGKRISYHCRKRPGFSFYEIGTSINLIKKYKGYDIADHYELEELVRKIKLAVKYTDCIGILLHHRFHRDQIDLIKSLLLYLKKNDYNFITINNFLENNDK